jgi:serine phosphatase RsbU (regulator of sigma subunit)
MAHLENRRLLREWLAQHYEVATPSGEGILPFDLGIVDSAALDRVEHWVRRFKAAVHPIFLPFLLVTSRQDARIGSHHLWETIDELLTTPIEKEELHARVEILLRARRLSLENAALAQELATEISRAAEVQAELLPREAPEVRGFELAGRCVPAREVGGDFFDWSEPAPGRVTLSVGDVMGKGMPAALLMATTRATLRGIARQNEPAAALGFLEEALRGDFERTGTFVTLFHSELDAQAHRLRYADAGHAHVFLRSASGVVSPLACGRPPLGVVPGERYTQGELLISPGDALVVYSDGLLEARHEVGMDALAHLIEGAPSAAEMVDRLVGNWREAAPPDDLTVVVLRCAG